MSKQMTVLASFGLATAYSVGLMITLLLVFFFAEGMLSTWTHPERIVEQLKIGIDGEPAIMSYPSYDYNDRQFRTLDGRILGQGSGLHWAVPNYMTVPGQLPVATEPDWMCQMIGFIDLHYPAGFWYFVYQPQYENRGYFVGFDSYNKLPIGFIGKQGFSATAPPRDEQFVIAPESLGIGTFGAVVSFTAAYGTVPNQVGPFLRQSSYLRYVYLISDGALQRVNLYDRTVETLLESEQLVSLASLQRDELVSIRDEMDQQMKQVSSKPLLAIRFNDRVELVDPADEDLGEATSYPLPEAQQLSDAQRRLPPRLVLHVAADGTLIYKWDISEPSENGEFLRLVWAEPNGQITRTEDVRFGDSGSGRQTALLTIASPAGGTFFPLVVLVGTTSSFLAEGYATNVLDALKQALAVGWPALLSAFLTSCLAVWLCVRRQQRFGVERSSGWLLFVALLGLPGLLGYIWSRRWPPLAACAECGRPASQDRPSCHRCGEEFARPPLLGTEVFA